MKSLIHKPFSLITKTRIRGLDAFTAASPASAAAPHQQVLVAQQLAMQAQQQAMQAPFPLVA